jgi:outer membrane lipoprotein-sorting protein
MGGKMRTLFIKTIVVGILCGIGQVPLYAVGLPDVIAGARAKYQESAKKLKDITIVETTTVSSPRDPARNETNTSLTTIYKKGDKFRIETAVHLPGEGKESGRERSMTGTVIFDGKDAWMMTPMFSKTRVPRQEVRQYETHTDWWENVSANARLAGSEVVDGRTCYLIDNTADRGAFFKRFWIDRLTYEMVRAETQGRSDKEPTSLSFSDFKSVGDITDLPYTIKVFSGSRPIAVTSVNRVDVNTGLSDRLFDPSTIKNIDARH